MIETVYNNENGEASETNKVQSALKTPKNIRQVGKTNAAKKVYVEDYVMTFIKQLVGEDFSRCKVAVLVGQYVKQENNRCIFIHGALEVEELNPINEIAFTNDIWTSIYENIKKHFTDAEIVGWFIGGPGYQMEDMDRIRKAHIDNFAGQDKTLLIYDNMEKEEAFLLFENNRLVKQEGYYIYYEKNEDMQNYMIEHNKSERVEEEYEDRVSKEIRTVIHNKKPMPQEENKSVSRLMYAAGTLLAVIILLVGAAMLNNYDQMKNMQEVLDSLSRSLQQNDTGNEKGSGQNTGKLIGDVSKIGTLDVEDSDGQLDVNVIPGELEPIEDEKKPVGGEELAGDNNNQKEDKAQDSDKNSSQKDSSSEAKKEVKYYTVVSGDSLAGIAYKLYNSANYISVIKKLNNIEDENMIYIGQKLIVP